MDFLDQPLKIKTHKIFDIEYNVSGLCVLALSRNLKLTTTLDRAITQSPCYVSVKFTDYENDKTRINGT